MALIAPTAYAQVSDLTLYGMSVATLGQTDPTVQTACVLAANALVDGYLAPHFKLPLTSWGYDLVMNVISIAAYRIMVIRGYDPEDPGDLTTRQNYDEAMKWLHGIQNLEITPTVVDSAAGGQSQGPNTLQASVSSESSGVAFSSQTQDDGTTMITQAPQSRGWNRR